MHYFSWQGISLFRGSRGGGKTARGVKEESCLPVTLSASDSDERLVLRNTNHLQPGLLECTASPSADPHLSRAGR